MPILWKGNLDSRIFELNEKHGTRYWRCHGVVVTALARKGVVGASGVDDHGSDWDRERVWGRSFVAGDRSLDLAEMWAFHRRRWVMGLEFRQT